MPIVKPPKERHTFEEHGSSLRVFIPGKKNFFKLFFLGFWLIFWAFGEIAALGIILAGIVAQLTYTSKNGPSGLFVVGGFILIWVSIWTIAGSFALYTFLWQLAGKEKIEIAYDAIKIQDAIFGLGRKKEYSATSIRDLRVSLAAASSNIFGWPRTSNYWGKPAGLLAFDYGAKTFRFGSDIDEAEAKQILEKILARFPHYGPGKPQVHEWPNDRQ